MIIVFAGSIGRLPVGGHAWANLQYLGGLRALGHDVFYLEDCGEGSWVHDWERDEVRTDLDYPTAYLRACLDPIGLGDRWIYRAGEHCAGMPLEDFRAVCAQADLMLVRAVPIAPWRGEYDLPRRRAFIDVDPGFSQAAVLEGEPGLCETIAHCERLFTLAQRLGAPDCKIPDTGHRWLPTVSPVWLEPWPVADSGDGTEFSAILQWRSFGKAHRYGRVGSDGLRFGQKESEFSRFAELPSKTAQPLRLALTGGDPAMLRERGWNVCSGWRATRTPIDYQRFITDSRAEFGVAKQAYVATRGGWFSDRSVCYLASGRPICVQDTGLAEWLPVGEGVRAFDDVAGAVDAIDSINQDYPRHRRAARSIAERHFGADRVLRELLDAAIE
jgi:hypothetical protein